jgi:hypothetical protein
MPLALLEFFGLEPSEWLAVVGGALEILGFAIVAVELVRAQRRELGHAGPFQFLVTGGRWIKYRIKKLFGKVETHEISAHLSGTSEMTGRGKARSGTESNELSERLRVLEENLAALDNEVDQHRQELDKRISKEAEALKAQIDALRADIEAKEAEAKEAFATSAVLQWWGVGIFIIGAMCSAAANVAY